MGSIEKYATTLEQIKDDRFQVNDWSNLDDGVGETNLSTTSKYSAKGGVKFVPAQLYAHDFDIELPEQTIIHSVTVEVKIKSSSITAKVPRCYFYYDGTIGHVGASYSSNIYSEQPDVNISDYFNIASYSMNNSQVQQYHLNKQRIESDLFGVILQFNEPIQKDTGGVSIEWIKVTVNYEEPEYRIEITGDLTDRKYEAQYKVRKPFGSWFDVTIKVHSVNQHITPKPKTVQVNIPLGLHIFEYHEGYGASFNPNTQELTLDWSQGVSPYLKLNLWCMYAGLKEISVKGDAKIGSLSKYVFVEKGYKLSGDDNVLISSGVVRRWDYSDFHFVAKVISEDNVVDFNIELDTVSNTNNELVEWKLDKTLSSEGVSIKSSTIDYIEFYVPPNKEVEIHWTGTFLPRTTGANTLELTAGDSNNIYTYDYVSLEPYSYEAQFINHDLVWREARVVSEVETGAYVYPIGVYDYDANMVQDRATLTMRKWDDIDYIGCVPLEQTHFNPKSTYKDTLLDTTYKNKTYMGKKGSIDETITLNVRLHPQQVTTIQGLVYMDKPVPINANHLCFEGDALNHRGWAELYGITAEETNPHWYKCSLNVKYITHNLNTRFIINKGSRVSDYFLPELMSTTHSYGGDLTTAFYIETSGGYVYDSDGEDYHLRNGLSLPYGKRFEIKSINPLSIKSQINFNWYSTRNIENIHNNMSRIIRLIDIESGNAVLEYEYYDVDFSRTYEYTCRVICRVLHKGAYKTILNRNLVLNYDSEYNPTQADGLAVYGSEIMFKIDSDKVTIQDSGMSGKELYIEDIDIENGQYYFDVEFTNNNMEDDSPDITNWVDINLQELEYTSLYSNYYKNMLVSPFPVPGKDMVFTRDSEEGTIFYLVDDGTECSYMVNPYYQYHCGVDLQSKDGISLFNLDNNYKSIYITNGLVKLEVNRYNGVMTLRKYDKRRKRYIITNHLRLTKYEDININSFTDDKLELQVSDTIITVWRGRPYVHFAHETEDILLEDSFGKIYADGVGNSLSSVPKLWSLVDSTNLLPSCIASESLLDASCWDITETTLEDLTHIVTLHPPIVNGGTASPSIFSADFNDYSASDTTMQFIIDGVLMKGTTEGIQAQETHRISHQFETIGYHTVRAIYYKSGQYYISNELRVKIEDNSYMITPTFRSSMYFMQDDFTCTLTNAGEPVEGETVTFYVNGLSYPKTTNEDGVARLNNRLQPKDDEYTVHMTYSEEGSVVATAKKSAKIMKGHVNISLETYQANNTQMTAPNVKKGGYVIATFTNNLNPNDDDIEEGEQYLQGKHIEFHINGRQYPRVTDNNGQARLNINLLPQNYDLSVIFRGDSWYEGSIKNYELVVEDNT